MSDISKQLDKIININFTMFMDTFLHVLNTEFVDEYVSTFSQVYDSMLVAPFERGMSAKDPTSPSKLKKEVLLYVRNELYSKVSAISSQKYRGGDINISAISNAVFGFPTGPSKGSTDKLKLFYFYLVGTPEEFVFISADMYSAWRSARNKVRKKLSPPKRTGHKLGRFEEGFLIPMSEYKIVYAADNKLPTPEQVKHPFSGAPPIHIFEEVQKRINFNKYLYRAVELMKKAF